MASLQPIVVDIEMSEELKEMRRTVKAVMEDPVFLALQLYKLIKDVDNDGLKVQLMALILGKRN